MRKKGYVNPINDMRDYAEDVEYEEMEVKTKQISYELSKEMVE